MANEYLDDAREQFTVLGTMQVSLNPRITLNETLNLN